METSLRDSVKRMQYTTRKITAVPVNTTKQVVSKTKDSMGSVLQGHSDFDYERMGKETAKAMEGMGVYLDKKPVGRIIAPVIDDELGRIGRRKT